MKNTKQCPKCQSRDPVRIEGTVGAYGSGNNILAGASIFSAVKVNRYVCVSCGFSEEWIEDRVGLDKIRSKYQYL
jgi:hypothetical protein